MLRPILRRFITAFDGEPDASFWKHIMYRADELCGKDDLSGWITGFCVWSNKGQWRGGALPEDVPVKPKYEPIAPPPVAALDPSSVAMPAPAPTTKRLDKVIPKWLRRHSRSLIPKPQEKSTDGTSVSENVAPQTLSNTSAPSSEGSIMVPGWSPALASHFYCLD